MAHQELCLTRSYVPPGIMPHQELCLTTFIPNIWNRKSTHCCRPEGKTSDIHAANPPRSNPSAHDTNVYPTQTHARTPARIPTRINNNIHERKVEVLRWHPDPTRATPTKARLFIMLAVLRQGQGAGGEDNRF